jgi:DNA invertase Pin-like site-specific DNA recombinase
VYTRITRDDDRRGISVRRQERICREFAEARQWTVVDVYCDNDRSASSYSRGGRPEFDRLITDLWRQKFDSILVLAQDRLLRRPEQLEALMSILAERPGATIETVFGGPLDTRTSAGRIYARVKVVFDAAQTSFLSA